ARVAAEQLGAAVDRAIAIAVEREPWRARRRPVGRDRYAGLEREPAAGREPYGLSVPRDHERRVRAAQLGGRAVLVVRARAGDVTSLRAAERALPRCVRCEVLRWALRRELARGTRHGERWHRDVQRPDAAAHELVVESMRA